ncbi:rhomboid-like protein [Nocardia miyunensis]|uniref:rhomboid-like protein n=1 Tax=Nocardia miyunensis TaxID=282684 RepID=UPI0008317A25|nr:rhomboid-like protein [Nocardia miyunensis]
MVGTLTADRAQARVTSAVGLLRRRHWLPFTVGYVVALIVVAVIYARVRPDVQSRILADTSTNLQNLEHGRVGTLLSSAFVIGDTDATITNVPLLACLLILVELRFGALRAVGTFLAGHIGATLLVAVGLWVGIAMHWLPASIGASEDVGISYGGMALFGSLIVIVPKARRIPWALVWLVIAVKGVVDIRDFTSVGHLLSYLIGLGIGTFVIARGRDAEYRMSWFDLVPLVASSALAVSFLLD